jgi:hypothetical protein
MTNPDANVTLGTVHDHEGEPLTVRRDYDALVVPAMTLKPAGVREHEKAIREYWSALARYQLRTLDFDALGVDLDDARDELAGIPNREGDCEPRNLELADWVDITRRLDRMRHIGGYSELRKLSELLLADEVPATEQHATDGPKWVEKLSIDCSRGEDARCHWPLCGCACHTDICAGCGDPAGFEFTPIENGRAICKQCTATGTEAAS